MSADNTSTWIVVLAAIFDFFLIFMVGGFAIAYLTGASTEGGFRLKGLPALALFALIFLYFWAMGRSGGTVFERLFGIV
jgi:hypothetical protein